jgi:hypothetical protein
VANRSLVGWWGGGVVKWLSGYFVKYRGFFANCPLPTAYSVFEWLSGRGSCGVGFLGRGWRGFEDSRIFFVHRWWDFFSTDDTDCISQMDTDNVSQMDTDGFL